MLKLDNNLLDELGLGGLPEEQKRAMLQHIYDTLELRVGTNLANQMTDQQLEEFEKFIDEGGDANQAQALQWLEANLPHYKQVVNQVFEELKSEIRRMAPQIMAASAPQPGQQQAQVPPQDPQQQAQAPQQQQMPQQAPPAYYQQPQTPPAVPQQPMQNPAPQQPYQYPSQQPPAGPGGPQPPQYPGV